jgi:hypothetical protein
LETGKEIETVAMETFLKICSRRRKEAEKAAEDGCTPKPCGWKLRMGLRASVLERGSPMPLWLKRDTTTNQRNIFATHFPLFDPFNRFNLFNSSLRLCCFAPLR